MSKEHPMLFSGPLVRAILDGRKTETRRPMKPQPQRVGLGRGTVDAWSCRAVENYIRMDEREILASHCPIASPGDTIWVRETCAVLDHAGETLIGQMKVQPSYAVQVCYAADGMDLEVEKWRPSIHMPRWASRITLRVTSVTAERVRDITEEQAIAEGVEDSLAKRANKMLAGGVKMPPDHVSAFARVWDSIYSTKRGFAWGENPWVWRICFEVAEVKR